MDHRSRLGDRAFADGHADICGQWIARLRDRRAERPDLLGGVQGQEGKAKARTSELGNSAEQPEPCLRRGLELPGLPEDH